MSIREIAVQRIEILYRMSQEIVKIDPELARRYIYLLLKISQRTRTKIPTYVKRGICKKCMQPLIPGFNSHTRIVQRREPHVATTCHNCQSIFRLPLRSKK